MTEQEAKQFISSKIKTPADKHRITAKYGVTRNYINGIINSSRRIPGWLLSEFGMTKQKITVYEVKKLARN